MPESVETIITDVAQRVDKIALELVFAEAGTDNGLLPINSFLSEMEGQKDFPPGLASGLTALRGVVDRVFNSTGLFDADAVSVLNKWVQWMQSAVGELAVGRPLPAPPVPGAAVAVASPAHGEAGGSASAAAAAPEAAEPLVLNMESDRELLAEFSNESQEHLQNIELGVLVLEDNPADMDTLNSIFRAFHTFKGGSGFLNLKPINRLAHELESLLDLARQQKLTIDSEVIDIILNGGDTLKQFVAQINSQLSGGSSPTPVVIPIAGLVERIRAVMSGGGRHPAPPRAEASAHAAPATLTATPPVPAVVERSGPESRTAATTVQTTITSVKVDTAKLDSLVDMVGEMVIAQTMVAQDEQLLTIQSQQFTRKLAQLVRITKDLQRVAMSLRMVPLRATFQKMNRLVRDVAVKVGKQVELKMVGEETELDRTITEEISDPLIHMIRNSVDHGIELPDQRVAAGKPAHGTVTLRAFHQGGSIVIEIEDDGAGLNKDRILAKAVERGLIKPGETRSDKEIFALIFEPGFSTAEVVTDLSGRGVGMDVVRRNIDKLRGKIEIRSTPGHGSVFTISLPLTLAIIEGLLVGIAGQRFIIPTLSVREAFRPSADMLSRVHDCGELINVRGHLIPLLRLGNHFGLQTHATDPCAGIVVVVECDNQQRCLLVDELLGKQEVVIKSLGDAFSKSPALSGAAILGDGRVGLILDSSTLVKLQAAPVV